MNLKKGLNILVTAGPTREPVDPVRFISNCSTGLLGYEIAQEAKKRGHQVVLISGPTALAKPKGVSRIDIVTAQQLSIELKKRFSWCDCLVMTAAVCDFRLKKPAKKKIKRKGGKGINLALQQNPDILKSLGRRKGKKFLLGFALETENLEKNAQNKLRQKNLDLIVATQMQLKRPPFGAQSLDVLIMDSAGHRQRIKGIDKRHLSGILLEKIERAA